MAAACSRTVERLAPWLRAGSSVAHGSSSCYSSALHGPDFYHGRSGNSRHFSQMNPYSGGKQVFLVDTLALVRKLEAHGISSKHAKAITSSITEVLNGNLENMAQAFQSQGKLQKEHYLSKLQLETVKLKSDIERLCSELSYKIDQATAQQRLDVNLEIWRAQNDLAKLDREIHALRAHLEVVKFDVFKYVIGSIVSLTVMGLAVARIML